MNLKYVFRKMLPNCDNIPVTGDLDSELDFLEQIPETLEDCFKILSTEARGIEIKFINLIKMCIKVNFVYFTAIDVFCLLCTVYSTNPMSASKYLVQYLRSTLY